MMDGFPYSVLSADVLFGVMSQLLCGFSVKLDDETFFPKTC